MKELGKRLAEAEYVLKQMDIDYIEKIPKDVLYYISDNKDYEYSTKFCNNKFIDMDHLHMDTIAILTYINMNFFMNSEEKESFDLLMKKTQSDIEKEKLKKYNPDNIFKNNTKSKIIEPETTSNTLNENITKNIELTEIKENFFQKIIRKIKCLHIIKIFRFNKI